MDEPTITKAHGLFGNATRVDVTIHATPARVWQLLTDAEGFPKWNSTVAEVQGRIAEGERLQVRVPGYERTLKPTVSCVVDNQQMTWTGGRGPLFKGTRTFVLTPRADGDTDFAMEERFSGLLVSLMEGPDFGPIFERYAIDLKHEAERNGVAPH
ncbi:MAG TPA: SRPBCC domain-containing protein [Vicinamibacterales bacterium]|jgi:uncharacterized protein YndB with AHSA1/START domain|nr:SRPBCC domain-containing protein [Vicinamibacterales bacterium]